MNSMDDMDDRPIYTISIVAEMLEVHPQTLRTYEREGLVFPKRTLGPKRTSGVDESGKGCGQRLYSQADVARLVLILDLSRNFGVNRAGVDIILRMRQRLESLQSEVELMLESMNGALREEFQEKIRGIFEEEQ